VSFASYIFLRARTPLHLSAEKNHVEMCRLLLQSNADIKVKDEG
jgi:ankyrin repeat protein